MKKIFKSIMMMALSLVAFTACDTDRDDNPTIGPANAPTEFVLNDSPLAGQYIDMNKDNKLVLTWSQPNYIVNTVVNYQVQVGLVQGGAIKWDVEDNGDPRFLDTSYTSISASISGEEISQSINHIDGVTDENNWVDKGYREVAFRVRACLQTTTKEEVSGSGIYSNAVTFKQMRADASIKGLACLYIVGSCSGWPEPVKDNAAALADWRIWETEIGSKIFHGVVTMPEAVVFRFYQKLDGWGDDNNPAGSLGMKGPDESTDCEFSAEGTFAGSIMAGKGAWSFPGYTGGQLDITVDLNTNKVTFQIVK